MKAAAKPGKDKKDDNAEAGGDSDDDDDDDDNDNDDEGEPGAPPPPPRTAGASHLPSASSSSSALPRAGPPRPAPPPRSSSSVAATATATAPKRKAAKDKDRPKRALSMFNFFFREEREKLMAERASGTGALAEADQRGIAEGKDPNTRKKELFALVGKIIAERWKRVAPDELERLKGLADQDMVRFNDAMSEYQINMARKKRVREEASASSEAKVSGTDDRRFPMYPRGPALNLYQSLGSSVAAPLAMAGPPQRPGLSVDDQLQRDPSLRLPTPIEDLLRARRQAVLGDYTPTSPNTAPSHSPQRHHPHQQSLAFRDPLAASRSSSGMLSSGSLRRFGEGYSESAMQSALLGSGAGGRPPYAPSLDASMGGGTAYETQQSLLMQLLQHDRYRLLSGSSAMDPLSSLGMGRHVGGYPHSMQQSSIAAGFGGFQAQQQQALQQQALQQQQQQQQQQLRQWPEAQSSLLTSSSDALIAQLQRQERDMLALLRQQQHAEQQRPSYQELLQMQQQQQQQQQMDRHESSHLRRAPRDSDSEGEPDPYP